MPIATIETKGVVKGLMLFDDYINSKSNCILIEGTINTDGGLAVAEIDFRKYASGAYTILLTVESEVRGSIVNNTNTNSLSVYYLIEGDLMKIKIISIYDGPILIRARGKNSIIKTITKHTNLDITGYERVTIS